MITEYIVAGSDSNFCAQKSSTRHLNKDLRASALLDSRFEQSLNRTKRQKGTTTGQAEDHCDGKGVRLLYAAHMERNSVAGSVFVHKTCHSGSSKELIDRFGAEGPGIDTIRESEFRRLFYCWTGPGSWDS